jgi:hypothetical protein
VNFLSQFIPRIREYLDAPPPKVAVVLDGGLVQCLTADRPNDVLPITFMVIDYDTEGSSPEELVEVPQGDGEISGAFARVVELGQAAIDLDAVLEQLKDE